MTTPVNSTPSVATSTATTTVDRGDQLSGDAFLQLLVAEMKYQDPSNPMSSSDMMAQTATLTQTQSLQQIATQNTQLLALQRSLSAGALVGRTVSYTATDGSTKTGTVTAVSIDTTNNTSTAQIDGTGIDVGRITQVSA
jgi:flagellar basal-body rod modification protein FlgD